MAIIQGKALFDRGDVQNVSARDVEVGIEGGLRYTFGEEEVGQLGGCAAYCEYMVSLLCL